MVQTRAQTRAQTAILRDQEVPDGMMVLEDLPKKKALSKQAVLPKEPLVEGWVLDQRKTVASGGYTSNVSFMALPPEIRNIIYELVLVRDGYFSIYCRLESKDDESRNFCTGWVERINMRSFLLSNSILTFAGTAARDSANLTSPFQILYRPGYGAEHSKPNYNLLITSRQIRLEASPVFWGRNLFKPSCSCITLPFLNDQPKSTQLCLRRLHFIISLGHADNRPTDDVYYEKDINYDAKLWAQAFDYIAQHLFIDELDIVVHDFRDEVNPEAEWDEYEPAMVWTHAVRKIRGVKKFGFVYVFVQRDLTGQYRNVGLGKKVQKTMSRVLGEKVLLPKKEEEKVEHMRVGEMATDFVRLG